MTIYTLEPRKKALSPKSLAGKEQRLSSFFSEIENNTLTIRTSSNLKRVDEAKTDNSAIISVLLDMVADDIEYAKLTFGKIPLLKVFNEDKWTVADQIALSSSRENILEFLELCAKNEECRSIAHAVHEVFGFGKITAFDLAIETLENKYNVGPEVLQKYKTNGEGITVVNVDMPSLLKDPEAFNGVKINLRAKVKNIVFLDDDHIYASLFPPHTQLKYVKYPVKMQIDRKNISPEKFVHSCSLKVGSEIELQGTVNSHKTAQRYWKINVVASDCTIISQPPSQQATLPTQEEKKYLRT